MEKLSLATDLTVQSDLAKQVYGMLNPVQYSVQMDSQNKNDNNRDNEGKKGDRNVKGHDSHEGGRSYGKGSLDPKEQALSSVVMKMLNDRGAEQIQPKA